VALTIEEIEDAGIKEVLQARGAALGSWALLDSLLQPTGLGSPFLFREPLGRSREVKVALSGLFGRFVARAYLERYFGFSVFSHVAEGSLILDGRRRIEVVRTARGDLPDWITCAADLTQLTVAEAKGCHDLPGPNAALNRAWAQVNRVDINAQGRRATLKRIAIATRWGSPGGAPDARLAVRDPEEEGDPLSDDERDALYVGLLRLHLASLLAPLGHPDLAGSLRVAAAARFANQRASALNRARQTLAAAGMSSEVGGAADATTGDLVGGVVTRAGPLPSGVLSQRDADVLARLALRPTFVGVERQMLEAALLEEEAEVRASLPMTRAAVPRGRADKAGTWLIPLFDADSTATELD
jgi:hypothetical protein